jgi:tRNA pseudouridine38-40 synthase
VWNVPQALDEFIMDRAAKEFIGTHDFTSFRAAGSDVPDSVRTVYDASVTRDGEKVIFSVQADGFLYNMVRILTGTLILVAQGKLEPSDIPSVTASLDRKRAGVTAPPEGLYLNRVVYHDKK